MRINGNLSRLHPNLTAQDTVFLQQAFKELGDWNLAFKQLLDSKEIDYSGIE